LIHHDPITAYGSVAPDGVPQTAGPPRDWAMRIFFPPLDKRGKLRIIQTGLYYKP
jgi:hypothetical protein